MGAASSIPADPEDDDRNKQSPVGTSVKDPNGIETGEIVWLINFTQFSNYGKYPPPKPKHNNLNVCRYIKKNSTFVVIISIV